MHITTAVRLKMTQDKKEKTAIVPTRNDDYPEWFQQVIKAADMAENSPVRGCMIIKPWGYSLWENIQRELDSRIKQTGHDNAYFPLFVPLSFLAKEAAHIEGFAKECAVVTHHRLEVQDGKLIPAGPLEEPLIIRPTSETIIGDAFSRWIESWRDLPVLINQWANIVRWEMRTRLFLRTTEFLWQEGHTAHATEGEAREEALTMLEVYRSFLYDVLAIPAFVGEKSPGERFPGAEATYTIEAMMQDCKALQAGTSHYLGKNFAKAFNIRFTDPSGALQHAYTTSWGTTTRLIGALIMCHGDDDGLRLPPRIAPKQLVILPIIPKPELTAAVVSYAEEVAALLRRCTLWGRPLEVFIDKRDRRGGEKNWEWIKKGVPIRIEVGPKDIESRSCLVARRDGSPKEKVAIPLAVLPERAIELLQAIQQNLLQQATAFKESHLFCDIKTFAEFKEFFASYGAEEVDRPRGFVLAKWCGDPATEEMLRDMKVTIRCLPNEQSHTAGRCVLTGREASLDALFAKAY